MDDLLKRRAYHDDSGRRKERRLCGGFDPNILAEKYMTEKGDLIRNTGFPERWQVKSELDICPYLACLPTFVLVITVPCLIDLRT